MASSKNSSELTIRILHVDDDPRVLQVSKQILIMENNFEVNSVTSVDEALSASPPQKALSDI